jgi:two-component system cell cycle response regulator
LENFLSNERSRALSEQSRNDSRYKSMTRRLEARDSCRVLVVDDDALVCARLSALLNASQYDVEVATTGKEALRILDATHCHIVLTDWQMPDMDGLALCRHIRLRRHESYIYVLMLTVRDTEHDVLTGLAAGADAYVVKGAKIDDILARLEIGRRITYEKSPLPANHRGNRSDSYTDPVTGAHNLGYLMHHLPRELARSQRYGHALAILHCDIDGFEPFHDRFGHEAGNDLLREFVAGADGLIRKGDWLARTDGAAFLIVLPETNAKGAHCAAHKLRQLFALHPLSTPAEPLGFTVSIGVTAVDAGHDAQSPAQIEAVLCAADRGKHAHGQLHGNQARADKPARTGGPGARVGGKNGLN